MWPVPNMNAAGTGKTGSMKTSSWPPQKEPPRHLSFNLGQGRWRTSGRACAGAVVPRRHLPVNETGYLIVVTRGHRDDMRVLRWAVSTNHPVGRRRKSRPAISASISGRGDGALLAELAQAQEFLVDICPSMKPAI